MMCTRGYLLGKTVGRAANDHKPLGWLLVVHRVSLRFVVVRSVGEETRIGFVDPYLGRTLTGAYCGTACPRYDRVLTSVLESIADEGTQCACIVILPMIGIRRLRYDRLKWGAARQGRPCDDRREGNCGSEPLIPSTDRCCIGALGTNLQHGLCDSEAESRLHQHGRNEPVARTVPPPTPVMTASHRTPSRPCPCATRRVLWTRRTRLPQGSKTWSRGNRLAESTKWSRWAQSSCHQSASVCYGRAEH